jgi:hypothetical protein
MEDELVTTPVEIKPAIPATALDMAEKIAKAAALLLAACYGLGLMVSNQYLLRLGVSDFSSVRPKYVVTGMWTLLLAVFIAAPLLEWFANRHKPARKQLSGLLFILIFAATFLQALLVFLGFSCEWRGHILDALHDGGLVVISAWTPVGIGGLTWLKLKLETRRRPVVNDLIVAMFLCISMLSLTHNIAAYVYGHIPEASGGGRAAMACVLLKEPDIWDTNGIKQAYPLQPTMREIPIVYQDEKLLVVNAGSEDKPRSIVISKDLVKSFTLLNDQQSCPVTAQPAAVPFPSPKPTP